MHRMRSNLFCKERDRARCLHGIAFPYASRKIGKGHTGGCHWASEKWLRKEEEVKPSLFTFSKTYVWEEKGSRHLATSVELMDLGTDHPSCQHHKRDPLCHQTQARIQRAPGPTTGSRNHSKVTQSAKSRIQTRHTHSQLPRQLCRGHRSGRTGGPRIKRGLNVSERTA